MEGLKNLIQQHNLAGKTVEEVVSQYNFVYHRIYNFCKKHNLWIPRICEELGLVLNRIDGLNSISRLDELVDWFSYRNTDWNDFDKNHKLLIKKFLNSENISFEAFLARYSISFVGYNEQKRAYQSIDDIKSDFLERGLLEKSIDEILVFEGSRVYKNVRSFAEKNGFKLYDIWFALGLSYHEKTTLKNGKPRLLFVYSTTSDMVEDFRKKKLIGKTKSEVWEYDSGKTSGRVAKFAKRSGENIQNLWNILEVKPSPKKKREMSFQNLDELKNIIEKIGASGMALDIFRKSHLDLYKQITKWQEKKVVL